MADTFHRKPPSVPDPYQNCHRSQWRILFWDEKPQYLSDLLKTHRLPFTAKVDSGDLAEFSSAWRESAEDKRDDVLQVLEIRRRKVVVCKKMTWDRKTGTYTTANKQYELPATYKGGYINIIYKISIEIRW